MFQDCALRQAARQHTSHTPLPTPPLFPLALLHLHWLTGTQNRDASGSSSRSNGGRMCRRDLCCSGCRRLRSGCRRLRSGIAWMCANCVRGIDDKVDAARRMCAQTLQCVCVLRRCDAYVCSHAFSHTHLHTRKLYLHVNECESR